MTLGVPASMHMKCMILSTHHHAVAMQGLSDAATPDCSSDLHFNTTTNAHATSAGASGACIAFIAVSLNWSFQAYSCFLHPKQEMSPET